MIRTWDYVLAAVSFTLSCLFARQFQEGKSIRISRLGIPSFDNLCLGIALLVALGSFLSPAAEAQVYIYGKASMPTGGIPLALAVGDFNGDGRLDLAVVNEGDKTVSVLLGKADGSYAAKVDYAVGNVPAQMAAGDFNGDGITDLAVVNSGDNTLSVLIGVGDGTFHAQVTYPTGVLPISIAAADFNGDKKTDLAVANLTDGTISLYFGVGDGTFTVQSPATPAGLKPFAIAASDVNGDGKPDLLLLSGPNPSTSQDSFSVLLNNGNGTMGSATPIFQAQGFGQLAVGDLNRDGIPDVVVTAQGIAAIFLGDGHGGFTKSFLDVTNGEGDLANVVTLADLNHDGIPDLVFAENGYVGVYAGKGDGTFQACQAARYLSSVTSVVAAGDFNNDGFVDVAALEEDFNVVSILLGNGDGSLGSHTDVPLPASAGVLGALATDLNGDGKTDMVVAQFASPAGQTLEGFLTTVLGNQNGTFQPSTAGATTSNIGTAQMVTGDFNGDSKMDVVMTEAGGAGGLAVFFGTGDGGFGTPITSFTGLSGLTLDPIAVGDFNGDGKSDVVAVSVTSGPGTTWPLDVFLSQGDGTFQQNFLFNVTNSVPGLVAADVNGDGKLDLVVGQPSQLLVSLGKGDGTFQAPAMYATNSTTSSSVVVGDFDHDGKVDIVAETNGQLLFYRGAGDGTFASPVASATAQNSDTLVAGDFNGDGILDVALQGAIYFGKGDGTFFSGSFIFAPPYAAADFNGDGTFDLAQLTPSNTIIPNPALPLVTVMMSAPSANLTAAGLTFGSQTVGTTSGSMPVTLSNSGNAPMNITSVAASGDFKETNTCGATLAIGKTCTIEVTFAPTASGSRSGSLTIVDNAPSKGQALSLSGMATAPVPPDFTISATPTSASVSAGGSTSYTLTITPENGFSGSVNVNCAGAPTGATCVATPATATVTAATTVAVNVTTTAASSAPLLLDVFTASPRLLPVMSIGLALLALLCLMMQLRREGPARYLRVAGFAACSIVLLAASGCGGGSNPPANGGTPAGTYTLTVTANSGGLSHSVTLKMTVN